MSSSRQSRTATPTAAQKRLSAERAAAARGRIAAAQRRRQIWMVTGSVGVVAVIVVALIIVKVVTGAGAPKSGQVATRANGSVSSAIATVPAAAFDGVHGTSATPPKPIDGALLQTGGKPRVLFIGGEFCPYCAAERWPLAVALSRFGTLHDLGQTRSSPNDVYPSTATLSFHGATYSSNYLAFTGKEAQSNRVQGRTYAPLDPIDLADQKLWKDVGQDGYPFLDIGGRYVSLQASYDPQTLRGLTQQQIAADLSDPKSDVGRAVLGSANQLTAAICTLTKNQPAAVCGSAGVRSASAGLTGGS